MTYWRRHRLHAAEAPADLGKGDPFFKPLTAAALIE